jgi:hypothetical protein
VEERFALRLTPDLARSVRAIAAAERRSVNKQLEVWLEAAVRRWRREHPAGEGDDPDDPDGARERGRPDPASRPQEPPGGA